MTTSTRLRLTGALCGPAFGIILACVPPVAGPPDRVTALDQVIHLGFDTAIPFSEGASVQTLFDIELTASVDVEVGLGLDLPARVRADYDPADVFPGASVPVALHYEPQAGAGPEVSLNALGTITVDCHVPPGVVALRLLFPIPLITEATIACAALETAGVVPLSIPIDDVLGDADFVAPFPGTAPVTVPLELTVPLCSEGPPTLCLGDLILTADLVIAPTEADPTASVVDGLLGGVVALGGSWPLEFTAADQIQGFSAGMPTSLTTPFATDLGPVIHWLNVSLANESVIVDLPGVYNSAGFDDPVFDDFDIDLGQILDDRGVDCQIGAAVGQEPIDPSEVDCGFAGSGLADGAAEQVRGGTLPIPWTAPELDTIDFAPGAAVLTPSGWVGDTFALGSLPLVIDLDRDDDQLADGEEVDAGTNPLDADSDDDGLTDAQEVHCITFKPAPGEKPVTYCPDPLDADSDNDRYGDGYEIEICGSDPTKPDVFVFGSCPTTRR